MKAWKDLKLKDRSGEIWVNVKDYEGLYRASSHGRIKAVKTTKRVRVQNIITDIHSASMKLSRDGIRKSAYIPKVIADAFLPPKPKDHLIWHKDRDLTNNNINNLEYRKRTDPILLSCDPVKDKLLIDIGCVANQIAIDRLKKEGIFNNSGELIGKICTKCNQPKLLNEIRTGYICVLCFSKAQGIKNIGHNIIRKKLTVVGLKICPECDLLKLFKDFYNSKNTITKKAALCKSCMEKRAAKYRFKNREKLRKAGRERTNTLLTLDQKHIIKLLKTQGHMSLFGVFSGKAVNSLHRRDYIKYHVEGLSWELTKKGLNTKTK